MKVYLDYVFFVNSFFDLILLLGISIILRRQVVKKRFLFGMIVGGFSGFIICFSVSSFCFFILKMLFGFIMLIVTFSYKNIKYTMNNFIYLVILSILLGGLLYLINMEIYNSFLGNFFENDRFLYIVLLLFTSLFFIYFYSKYIKGVKADSFCKYNTSLFILDKKINLCGFLDTGNKLMYKRRPVLILNNSSQFSKFFSNCFYLPFSTLNSLGVMKCVLVDKIYVEGKGFFKNVYLALSNDKFHLGDADIILNVNLWEDDNDANSFKFFKEIF